MTGRGARIAGASALILSCAACSHVLPLRPEPPPTPAPRHLASAIVLQTVLSQPGGAAGGCPAGYAMLRTPSTDFPQVPDACYRKTGHPATFTSAGVSLFQQPAGPKGQPAMYVLRINVPAAEATALTAITTQSVDSREQMAITVAGLTWGVPFTAQPLTNGQFEIGVQSRNQALRLQRMLLRAA